MFLQTLFKTLQQGHGIRSTSRKARQNIMFSQAANLPGVSLDDLLAQGYLSIRPEGDLATSPPALGWAAL
jgi:hypothetical protein